MSRRTKLKNQPAFVDPLTGVMMKVCSICEVTKPLTEFVKSKERPDGVVGHCKECRNKIRREEEYAPDSEKFARIQREGRKKHPTRYRMYDLKKRFRLSPEAYYSLLESQDGKCAGCGSEDSGEESGSWHVDHDHNCCANKSGRTCGKCVRGILCRWCNMALGNAKENSSRLRGLADYIDRVRLSSVASAP